MNAVADERILHGADDRDATRDSGLEVDRRVHFPGNGEQFDATLSQQCLVAGDYWFFRPQGGGHDVESVGRPADQLDDDIHRRIGDE